MSKCAHYLKTPFWGQSIGVSGIAHKREDFFTHSWNRGPVIIYYRLLKILNLVAYE